MYKQIRAFSTILTSAEPLPQLLQVSDSLPLMIVPGQLVLVSG